MNTHSLKGECKVKILVPGFILNNDQLLKIKNDYITVKNVRKHQNFYLVTFKEINSIDDAMSYKNHYLNSILSYNSNKLVFVKNIKSFKVLFNNKEFIIKTINESTKYIQFFTTNNLFLFSDEYIENIDYDNKIICLKKILTIN